MDNLNWHIKDYLLDLGMVETCNFVVTGHTSTQNIEYWRRIFKYRTSTRVALRKYKDE